MKVTSEVLGHILTAVLGRATVAHILTGRSVLRGPFVVG
jgi:hypothetical protein